MSQLTATQLQGESEREVVRVSVECCLQERSWNPYYVHLLQRLLSSSKAHRVTLQYCLWDQFKLVEQTDMRRLINLAHLTGQLIASFTLSSSILKVQPKLKMQCWVLVAKVQPSPVCVLLLMHICCCGSARLLWGRAHPLLCHCPFSVVALHVHCSCLAVAAWQLCNC